MDLLVVAADKQMEATVRGLLERPRALGIHPISFKILVHPGRDPGVFREGAELSRHESGAHRHCLVVLDYSWTHRADLAAHEMAEQVETDLAAMWGDRARCVVIDPELEVWVWSDSPHVARVLGWSGRASDLRAWLTEQHLWQVGAAKPAEPKAALERALHVSRIPRSSSLYRKLAQTVSLRRCTDPAFHKFKAALRTWFGV